MIREPGSHRANVLRSCLLAALGWAASLAGCIHATTTEEGQDREASLAPTPSAQPPQPGPGFVVQAPEDLFVPGGITSLRQVLMEKGYLNPGKETLDPATQEAIVRFQRDQRIPATGFPDAETLRRLGLEPSSLYRKRSVPRSTH